MFEGQKSQGYPYTIQGRKYKQYTKMADSVKKKHTIAKGENVSFSDILSSRTGMHAELDMCPRHNLKEIIFKCSNIEKTIFMMSVSLFNSQSIYQLLLHTMQFWFCISYFPY
jgi:hypothetical protein